jgi:hypothetical protein
VKGESALLSGACNGLRQFEVKQLKGGRC